MVEFLRTVRVLDLSDRISGAWCTRLFADSGARVAYVAAGQIEEHLRGEASPHGLEFFLAGKRHVDRTDTRAIDALAAEADVIVTSFPAPEAALRISSGTIRCTISPHGTSGARARYAGNDLTAYAWSGWASINGLQGRAPLKGPRHQASFQAGTVAFGAILCALAARERTGIGDDIDVSEVEVLTATFAPALLRSLLAGSPVARKRNLDVSNGPVPVADGYFSLPLFTPDAWEKAMRVLGLADLADSERLRNTGYRLQHPEEYVERVQDALRRWRRSDLMEAMARERITAGPVLTFADLQNNEHLLQREFLGDRDDTARAPLLRPAFRMRGPAQSARHAAPSTRRKRIDVRGSLDHERPDPPLAGFRGLSITHAWAGSMATQLLGLMGAEVLQIETTSRLDIWRGATTAPMPVQLSRSPSARHPWNCNPLFNSVNLAKRSVTLDLTTAEGKALVTRLIAEADFVVENFTPRVMRNLGLHYEALCEIKSDIILCSISGYGSSGPWSDLPAVGGTIEPTSGLSSLTGYESGPPMNSGQMYPDAIAALYGFAAVAGALFHRERTGQGRCIEISMQEAALSFIGDAWLEWVRTGAPAAPEGNHHSRLCPHNIYPCRPEHGRERWIAIAAQNDTHWASIARVARQDAWVSRYPTAKIRKALESDVDRLVSGWTTTHCRDELVQELCEAGVPAAPVLDALEVAADPVLRNRGNVVEVTHPEAGTWPQAVFPCQSSRWPRRAVSPAPCLGADSEFVLCGELGLTADEFRSLVQRGVTGTDPR